jgi:hypothetical protein
MNPKDAARDAVLRYLYSVHATAKSPRSAGVGIRELQAKLKPQGLKQQDVASNLDYLIQKGWAREVVEERSFVTPRGTRQPSQKVTYKISDLGIDKLEGASTYERQSAPPGINITTVKGVTIVGDGNVVNTVFADASSGLGELRALLLAADNLSDEVRLNAVADIDSLQGQLQKPDPAREVIRSLWASVERIATVSGFVDAAEKVSTALGPLLG